MDHGYLNQGFAMLGQDLIISRMPAKIHQPCKRALDDPPAFDDGKSIALFGDDFQVYFVRLFLLSYPRSDRLALFKYKRPLTSGRRPRGGRPGPPASQRGAGRNGSICCHCASVRSVAYCIRGVLII